VFKFFIVWNHKLNGCSHNKGATSGKVRNLTKDYNVHMVFMYWIIKSHNYILNNIFGLDVDIETKYDHIVTINIIIYIKPYIIIKCMTLFLTVMLIRNFELYYNHKNVLNQ
jgi:hypothetical protein